MTLSERVVFSEDNVKRSIVSGVAVFVILLLVGLLPRLLFQSSYREHVAFNAWENPKLDAHTFHQWALRISDGDLLSREMVHPYHRWSLVIASPDEWESWYGEKTFHQAPLYPYLIALLYTVASKPDPTLVHWIQAFFGALMVPLVYGCARISFSRSAAWIAALLAAFSGGTMVYEITLLRAPLLGLINAALLLATLLALRRPRASSLAVVGGIQALAILAKPTGLLLLPITLVAMVGGRKDLRFRTRLLAYSVPLLLLLAPAIARNLTVGAPLFRLSTRGPEVFLCGNAASSTGVGWFPEDREATLLRGDARTILRETQGKLLPTVAATLKTHPSIGSYLELLLGKAAAYFSSLEIPNNINYYEVKAAVPILGIVGFVPFGLIGPLALAGIALCLRSPRRHWVLLSFCGITCLSSIALFIVARFRAPALPFLLPFAAYGTSAAVAAIRDLLSSRSERGRAGGTLTLLAIGLGVGIALPGFDPGVFRKPTEAEALFGLAGHMHSAGKLREADRFYSRSLEDPDLSRGTRREIHFRRGQLWLTLEDAPTATKHLNRFFQLSPPNDESVARARRSGAHINRGIATRSLGLLPQAVQDFRAAALLSRDDPNRLLSLARTLEECGAPKDAAEVLGFYLELKPEDSEITGHRRRLLEESE